MKKDGVLISLFLLFGLLCASCGNGGGGPSVSGEGAADANITTRMSISFNGNPEDGDSASPSISSDGRYVAFESAATNLVAGDTNGRKDVFVHDRNTGTTTRVSVSFNGNPEDGDSASPSISSDGRYVAFESAATNLVSGDNNGVKDIFVRDRNTGETTRVSVDTSGNEVNGACSAPSISSDGRFVAFESVATDLVAGDNNGHEDVFVHDRNTGATSRVSVSSAGVEGNLDSSAPSISSDGRFIAFESTATNLVLGDTNGLPDVFIHDRDTDGNGVFDETGKISTTLVSVSSAGSQGDISSSAPAVSLNGLHVAFESPATNLVSGDLNGLQDIFVHGP